MLLGLTPSLIFLITMLIVIGPVAGGWRAYAQDLEPRTYANIPIRLNFLVAGYGYTSGGVATDPSLPLENASIETHSIFVAYARSLNMWGKSGKFDVVLPYAWLSGSAEFAGPTPRA